MAGAFGCRRVTKPLFLCFLIAIVAVVMVAAATYLRRRSAVLVSTLLSIWLIYVGVLGYFGVVGNSASRPPGAAYVMIPAIVLILLLVARPSKAAPVARAVPLWLLIGLQTYRIGVELFLHQPWLEDLAPRMLTFAGANVDIVVGLSAPLAAWVLTRARVGLRVAQAWNVFGLLALANVAIRSALTVPGPLNLIHAEVPNMALGTFPFMFIPGFFAPLAAVLHVLALRSSNGRLREERAGGTAAPGRVRAAT